MDDLDLLRNALLVTLLVMLVYVLYRRLLRVLRRDHVVARYPALANSIRWTGDGEAHIELTLADRMYLIVDVYDQHDNRVLQLAEGEFLPGVQEFTFHRRDLIPGRYYYKVISPHEQASQYFEV